MTVLAGVSVIPIGSIPIMAIDAGNYEFGGSFWTKMFFSCSKEGHLQWDIISVYKANHGLFWTSNYGMPIVTEIVPRGAY